jgi:hypothetical protein
LFRAAVPPGEGLILQQLTYWKQLKKFLSDLGTGIISEGKKKKEELLWQYGYLSS